MDINFGDRILYEDSQGQCLKGEIVDIWKNHRKEITDYISLIDSGKMIRVKPNYPNWCKLEECVCTLRRVVSV